MQIQKFTSVFLFLLFITGTLFSQKSSEETYNAENVGYFITPVETPYGIVFTDNYASEICLLRNNIVETLVESPGCGRYFIVSKDGRYISYKAINEYGKQASAYFDLKKNKSFLIFNYSDKSNQINFNPNIKFSEFIKAKVEISNLTPISPDGKKIVYDVDQKFFITKDLSDGKELKLPNDGKGVIYPKWSPDSKKLLFQNRNYELLVYDFTENKLYKIGSGGAGNWDKNSENIVFQRTDSDTKNFILKSSEIFISDYKGLNVRQITFSPDIYEMTPSFDLKGDILFQTYDKRQIVRATLNILKTKILSKKILLDNPKNLKPKFYDISKFQQTKSVTHLTNDVPYIHQKYDAPTGRNGGSACAPTTSNMALAYYNRLPKWPVEAENYPSVTGSPHYSDYSGYVLDRYKYNEFSFDAYSSSKNAYGGYAYMWVSPYTSPGGGDGMRNYQELHDMASGSYVWTSSATFSKTQTEINNEYPQPICSWITHSGHLTLCVGYVNGQHTLIFNDPWGNKNTPGYPSYDGKDSYYDWPGYNNGYQNLDPDGSHGTVAWTLTARSSEPVYDDLTIENINYNHGFYINNSQNGSKQRYFRHVKSSSGHSGHIWWTGGEGGASSDICYVTWTPTISSSATYKVEVYIPSAFTDAYSTAAVTSSAYYKIFYDGGNTSVTVDQLANQGTWVDLGTYQFASGQSGYVYLGDAVATADNGKKVLFDAVKFTQVSSSIALSVTNVSCKGSNDGTATVTSAPGPDPHSYSWSHDAGNTTNSATGLAPGNYSVTVTDANNIPYTENYTVSEADIALSLSTTATDPTTVGGTNGEIIADISGGVQPYSISWSHDGTNTTNGASNLPAGTYTVTVSDDYGCTLQETATLSDPECCTLLFADFSTGLPDGWANIVNSGGNTSRNWRFDDPGNRYSGGSLSGADFDADFAIFDDDYFGNDTEKSDASLTTKAIDCSGKSDVILKITHKFRSSSNTATGKLEVSNDNSNWNLIESWSTSDEGAIIRSWDISAYAANQPTVYIRWTYIDNNNWSNYWAIDNVEVYAPLSGTLTIKKDGSGNFGNLTDAINDLNHCGVGTGGVTFLVEADDIFEEELPEITATGTASDPIVFKTSDNTKTNPVVKSNGSAASDDAAFKIAGGDYITFDGIDVEILSGTDLEYGYYFYNPSGINGTQHNTVKNCSITLNKTNTNSVGILQLIQTSVNPTSADGANSFNKYQNVTISNVYFGIKLLGYDVSGNDPLYDDACEVSNCTISDFGGSNLRAAGIMAWSQKNSNYFNNTILGGTTTLRTYGIYIAEYSNGNIYDNRVYNLYGTDIHVVGIRTYAANFNIYNNKVSDVEGIKMATGIECYGGTSSIYNNFIYDIKAPSGNSTANGYPSVRGISARATSGTQTVYYNSVYIAYYSSNSGNESTCLYLENANADLRNNIFENNTDATTGTRANVLYFKGASDLANLSANTNNNCYYNGIANTKYALAYDEANSVDYLDLSAYQSASPGDVNSIEENPPFKSTSSPYDLHIDVTQTTGISNGGVPISGYTTDFEGDTRNATNPDMGADEYDTGGPLCGTYTIDNTAATGGTNFNNFTDAFTALNDRGISCAVTFNVSAGQIFSENPPAIETSGTSGNTINFQKSGSGANPVISASGNADIDTSFAICLKGVDYYTFDGIDIQISGGQDLEFGYFITNISPTDGAQHNTIKNCSVTLNNTNVNSVGIYQSVNTNINPTSADGVNSFNTYDNVNISNAYFGMKLYGYDVSGQEPLYDDATEVKNCSISDFGHTGTQARAVGIHTWSQKNLNIHNNTIFNGTTDYRTLGIYAAGNNQGEFYNNTVYGLYGTGSQVVGLRQYESDINFYNNNVYDIEGVEMASGIEIYGGTSYIYNNFIRDIRTPNSDTYNYPTTRGISDRKGTAYIYNNSVLLNYVSTASTNESAGIFVEGFSYGSATADIRNNIIVNKTDVTTGGYAVALYKSAEYSTISTNSNNNLYYAGTPSAKNLIFYDTNVGDRTIADYLDRCATYEQNSISEDAPFMSISDLHIQTSAISYIDGGGQVIASVANDYDGDVRDAGNPDIGADEYNCDFVVWRGTTDTDWAVATNWQKQQVPTATDDVIIPDVSGKSNNFPIITSTGETNDLTIQSGANLQIYPDYSLSVNGVMTNDAGISGLIIKSDASGTGSFINATANVPATVERYLSGMQWHYLTAPVVDAPLSMFNTNNFYYYDETTSDSWSGGVFSGTMGWTTVTAPNLSTMEGYAYYFNETTLSFTGSLNTGTYTSPLLSWTNTSEADQYEGWHLLGNPYPSAIDFSQANIDAGNISLTNLDNTVYFYDDNTDNYKYYNTTTGGVNSGTQYIPAMQGFFVHASSDNGQMQITDAARTHNTTDFYKSKTNNYISLFAVGNNLSDETKIVVIPEATAGFDNNFDIYKMFSQALEHPFLYSLNNNIEYALNAVPEITENTIIPLGISSRNAGAYQIKLNDVSGIDLPIYIYDKEQNVSQNLLNNNIYEFNFSGGVDKSRFELRFSEISEISDLDDNLIFIYPNPASSAIFIKSKNIHIQNIELLDISGKILLSTKNVKEIDIERFKSSVYFLKINTENGIFYKKVIKE